jgi:RNA polymerase sigma-70 factor (ECF subfamily)
MSDLSEGFAPVFRLYLLTRDFLSKLIISAPRCLATMGEANEDVTRLLRNWSRGDEKAASELFPIVYDELRRLARRYMSHERPDHTLQATALIHEAYVRLVGQHRREWQNRTQFFAVAAQMMRRVLVDHARKRAYQKRGGVGNVRLDVEQSALLAPERREQIIALDSALERLAAFDARKARVVELRYFGGLEAQEIAEVLGISTVTVTRDWKMARAWLRQELQA